MGIPVEPLNSPSRRGFFSIALQGAALLGLGGVAGALTRHVQAGETHWQIDPHKCAACGRCATNCVLKVSAVKCRHAFSMCGYCKLCTGYFEPEPINLDTGAENQVCPTGALKRRYFNDDPYYEYTIDAPLCIACGKCVKGCVQFGNGSLYLQIDQKRCLHCNECAIAVACPTQAISRVPASQPYQPKDQSPPAEGAV